MYESLKEIVLKANLLLVSYGLVKLTWGNVSQIDRNKSVIAIKPSGVSYENMTVDDIVIVDMKGQVLEEGLNPSSDTATHLELYKAFHDISGVVHTHSRYGTIWAQSGIDIPALGTTHADHFYGDIPCTRSLHSEEITTDYEKNTGKVIVETFYHRGLKPLVVPGVVVMGHAPFCWGKDALDAVRNALILEEISSMALFTRFLNPTIHLSQELADKHFFRKHGKNAYYGQR